MSDTTGPPLPHYPTGVVYARGGHDLARFRSDPADDRIGAFVASTRDLLAPQLDELRARLDVDEMYVLLAFARRTAARALRDADLVLAVLAVDALTLVDVDRIDFRDLRVDFPLLAARDLGWNPADAILRAAYRSSSATASFFEAARARAATVTLGKCLLLAIRTRHGVGFMDDLATGSSPPVDLAQDAVDLADRIDAEGSYVVGGLYGTDLPAVWFDVAGRVMEIETRGCVAIRADHVTSTGPYSHGLLVFAAELPSPAVAAQLADGAARWSTTNRPQTAFVADRHLVLFIGGSATMREAPLETVESLRRFHALAAEVFVRAG